MQQNYTEIIFEVSDKVATLSINRPFKRNSLSKTTIDEMTSAIELVRVDRSIRVLVLTGVGGKAFCSGADLSTMFHSEKHDREVGQGQSTIEHKLTSQGNSTQSNSTVDDHAARGALADLFIRLWELGKPTIAKVNGYCLAGGFGLAMACDIVIASRDSQFGTPEINVGLWPYMITVPLLRSMAPKVALELMMTGRKVSADEGFELGFVNKVVETDRLDEAVATISKQLASCSPEAMALGRSSFYNVLGFGCRESLKYLQAMLSVTAMSGDAQEGITAFMDKRKPSWQE